MARRTDARGGDGIGQSPRLGQGPRLGRRDVLRLGLAASGGAVALGVGGGTLSGCSSSSGSGTLHHGVSSATPRPGGALTFGVEAEESAWYDPVTAHYDSTGILYARTVFDPLATVGRDGKVYPYLAESIEHDAEYLNWTITVRKDVVFHDDTTCDGPAVAYNLERALDSSIPGNVSQFSVTNIEKVTVTGPFSVMVTMKEPWVPFDYYLAGGIGGQIAWIAAPSMFKGGGTPSRPIGTGPFVFSEWVPNDHFTATRNPRYWRPGLPYLDSITFRPIPSAHARADSLRAGQIDIMHTDETEVIVSLRNDPRFSLIDDAGRVVGEPDVNFTMVNVSKLTDVRVRQALAYALDQRNYIDTISNGITEAMTGPFPPGSPYFSPTGYPTYNLAKAKALVAEVERERGGPVTVEYATTSGSQTTVEVAEYFQAIWGRAGIKVTPRYIEQNQLINTAIAGDYELVGWRQFSAFDPDMNYIFWGTTSGPINFSRNDDPEVQHLLDVGRQSPDPATRIAAYQGIARRFAVDLPYLWTDRALWSVIAAARVMNFDNPTTPEGIPALGMFAGVVWPTQIWLAR
jgi:peptide/nickel transport system substrate-binding protein